MATEQQKKINLKLENDLSSGDYIKNEIQKDVNKGTKTSKESHIIHEGEDNINIETNSEISDNESAYEESFYSDHSDDETELTNITHYPSMIEMPLFNFTRTKANVPKENILHLNKLASVSNISDKSGTLEDKFKYLRLYDVQTMKNMRSQSFKKNMSFTNEQIMKIEHDNELLLKKIMSRQSLQKIKKPFFQTKLCSNAINRKKFQKRIEEDNIVLLRRLQQAKSCAVVSTKIHGYRTIYL